MVRRSVEWVVVARHREEGEGPSSGLAWAKVGRLRKIPGKMKQATKIVSAENELGSTAEFRI
jgi:hypothetical protein